MIHSLTRRAGALRTLMVSGCLMLAQAVDAQQPARAWTPAETHTPATQQSKLPQLAMDGSGHALVTWTREQGGSRQTQTLRLAATGSASPIANLYSPASTAAVPFEASDVALNESGQGAAIWARSTGTGPSDQMVQAAIFTGTTWRGATNLMPAPAAGLRSPRVGVDGDGNVVAVWVQVMNGVAVVRASRFTVGGTWSPPVTISAATESVNDGVAMGVDDAGTAVVVWTGTAGGVPTLRAAQFVAAGTWSAPVSVAPAGRAPSVLGLSVARSGTAAFVAYRGFDGTRDLVRAARLDLASGTWSAPADVSTSPQQVIALDIAADDHDRAIAIWNLLDGTVQTARYDGTWGSPTDRATGALTRDLAVDMDAAGNGVAAWTQRDGSRYIVQAAVYAQATARWTEADDVPEADGDVVAPRVLLHTDGTAVLVWQSDSDVASVKSSRYVLASAPLLRPAVVSGARVTLAWTPGTGTAPTGYTLVASLTAGGTPMLQLPVGTQTSASVIARDGGYYVRVLANVSGVQIPSNEIFVIVGRGPVPTAPGDLVATVNGSIVTLTWTPPVNEAVAPVRTYYVAAGSVPGISNLAFFPTGSAQTTYVTGVVPNGSYWVRVYAESAGGLGPASTEIRIVVGPPPPGAPILSGGANGPGSVLLQWTAAPAPGAPVTGYQLRAGYQPGQSDAAVIDRPPSPLSYGATNIPPGTYYVRVVALSASGPGDASNEVVVTIP